jgi:hypothetical protein
MYTLRVNADRYSFLVEEKYIDPSVQELRLAINCIDYLNYPTLLQPTSEKVLSGEYIFLDYAVLQWIRHLEVGLWTSHKEKDLIEELVDSLEAFLDQHWYVSARSIKIPRRTSKKLEALEQFPVFLRLEQAAASMWKQITTLGSVSQEDIVLDLSNIVSRVRQVLELTFQQATGQGTSQEVRELELGLSRSDRDPESEFSHSATDLGLKNSHLDIELGSGFSSALIGSTSLSSQQTRLSVQNKLEKLYGINIFKCPRFSCIFFTEGFATSEERNRHVGKHERPFRCTDESCHGFTVGFSTKTDRDRHMKETHYINDSRLRDDMEETEFPTEQEIRESIPQPQFHAVEILAKNLQASETEVERQYVRPEKQLYQKKIFHCEYCDKTFAKKFNMQSHMVRHTGDRPFRCTDCGAVFSRFSDMTRHKKVHSDVRRHVCGGSLATGAPWGCGKACPRADALQNHYRSKIGEACRQAWRLEQRGEQPIEDLPLVELQTFDTLHPVAGPHNLEETTLAEVDAVNEEIQME